MGNEQRAQHADADAQPRLHASESRGGIWRYLRERFPPAPVALLALTHAALLLGLLSVPWSTTVPALALGLVAQFVGALLRYRVVDEHKDAALDAERFPSRPVPAGLVSLRQLRAIGVVAVALELGGVLLAAAAMGQVALAGWYLPLLVFSAWTALDRRLAARSFTLEFAVHQLAYALVALFAVAVVGAWGLAGVAAIAGYTIAFVAVELARKLEPRYDAAGAPTPDTYSTVWGRRRAVSVLAVAIAACGTLAGVATWVWVPVLVGLAGAALVVAVARRPGWPSVAAIASVVGVAVAVVV